MMKSPVVTSVFLQKLWEIQASYCQLVCIVLCCFYCIYCPNYYYYVIKIAVIQTGQGYKQKKT